MFIFPVQLTTSRISNLTRLIHTLLYVMTIHIYIYRYIRLGPVWNTFSDLGTDGSLGPSFMGIGFGSGILLDLVFFADRTDAEPKSHLSIFWDMGGSQRFERRVCIFLAVCFQKLKCIARASPTGSSTAT